MKLCIILSKRLNEVRTSRSLSITDFSEELGISRSSLQSILSGKGNPRLDTIEFIARKLQMEPRLLLSLNTHSDTDLMNNGMTHPEAHHE